MADQPPSGSLHKLPGVVSSPRLTAEATVVRLPAPARPPPPVTSTPPLPRPHLSSSPPGPAAGPSSRHPAAASSRCPPIPPPPPLLRIPSLATPTPHCAAALPPVSSGPCLLSHHQTPYQGQYPGPEPAPSHAPALDPAPAPATNASSDSELSSGGDRDQNNAAKCREYREKNKIRRRQEEIEYYQELRRNEDLKKQYEHKEKSIAKLKAYYYKCLKNNKFHCKKKEKSKKIKKAKCDITSEASNVINNHQPPTVTIKSEIKYEADVLVKQEYN